MNAGATCKSACLPKSKELLRAKFIDQCWSPKKCQIDTIMTAMKSCRCELYLPLLITFFNLSYYILLLTCKMHNSSRVNVSSGIVKQIMVFLLCVVSF
jgi:hypothetical protein